MKKYFIKFVAVLSVTVLVLTSFASSGVAFASEEEKALTLDDITQMTQTELESLSSEQIKQTTDSLSELSEEELGTIDQEVWDKIISLWECDSETNSLSQIQAAIARIDQKPIALDPPGARSDQEFYSANWGQSSGGGSGIHDWDSSYVLGSNRNNVWAEAQIVGYGYASAATGVYFSTSPWEPDESHEVDITFDGWTGWWMTTLGQPGTGSFKATAYVYDVTNETFVGSKTILSQSATILFWWDEDYNVTVRTTLWGDRDYIVFVNSHITAFAYFFIIPGYCQSESDTGSYHTYWSSISLDWLN